MPRRIKEFPDDMAELFHDEVETRTCDPNLLPSRNVTLCVTSDCQLRCTYCYERHKGSEYMSFETAKKFLDMVIYGTKGMRGYVDPDIHKFIVLEFIGGEPLLAVDLIDRCIEYWMDTLTDLDHPWLRRFRVSISSNGVNYFDRRVQDFIRKWDGVLSLSITLDGNRELHDACRHYKGTTVGCYDVAHAACQDLISRGYPLGSKMTYAPENLPFMYDAMVAMLDDGYSEVFSNCAFEPEYTVEDARLFYAQGKRIADEVLRRGLDMDEYTLSIFDADHFRPLPESENRNWCGGTGDMLACDWDGRLYPCIRYMSMSLGDDQPPLVIGDVDRGILATPEQREVVEGLGRITRRSQSTDECFDCPIASGCAWCSAWNYQLYGTADRRCTRICPMHRSRALFNYYFWNRYYGDRGIPKRMAIHIPEEWALEIVGRDEWDMIVALAGSGGDSASSD